MIGNFEFNNDFSIVSEFASRIISVNDFGTICLKLILHIYIYIYDVEFYFFSDFVLLIHLFFDKVYI